MGASLLKNGPRFQQAQLQERLQGQRLEDELQGRGPEVHDRI